MNTETQEPTITADEHFAAVKAASVRAMIVERQAFNAKHARLLGNVAKLKRQIHGRENTKQARKARRAQRA